MRGISTLTVDPQSRRALEAVTEAFLKRHFPKHLEQPSALDVVSLIEFELDAYGFRLHLRSDLEPGVEAQTNFIDRRIEASEEAYLQLCAGVPRVRFTFTHEAMHVLLHVPQILRWDPADWRFSRRFQSHQLPAYYSAEWQANYATGALLMPRRTLIPFTKSLAEGGDLLSEVARKYGVSHEAAETRLSKVGLTKANPRVGRGPWG